MLLAGRWLFTRRSFASTLLGLLFVGTLVSGLVLFIAPPGRVANWSGWTIAALSKHQWGALHIAASFTCLLIAGLHVFFNWRALLNHLRTRPAAPVRRRADWPLAVLVTGLVCWGSVAEWPPFTWLMSLNEQAKNSWEAKEAVSDPLSLLVEELQAESTTGTVSAVERRGEGRSGGGGGGGGGGWGRRTLADVAAERQLTVEQAVARLQAAGVTAQAGQTIREIVSANQLANPAAVLEKLGAGHE